DFQPNERQRSKIFGTSENSQIWLNLDAWGISLSLFLWIIMLYAEGVYVYHSFV
ncbi:unnamed protein product, partial [Heterosigma akashiwo]